jgi:hypothetical protein
MFVNVYSTVLYCTGLYCTVLCCTVLYCAVLYCTLLYYCHRVSNQLKLTNIPIYQYISITFFINFDISMLFDVHVTVHS